MGFRGGFFSRARVRQAQLSAVVTRADGRVEDLGVIAFYSRNPLRQLLWDLRHKTSEAYVDAAARSAVEGSKS